MQITLTTLESRSGDEIWEITIGQQVVIPVYWSSQDGYEVGEITNLGTFWTPVGADAAAVVNWIEDKYFASEMHQLRTRRYRAARRDELIDALREHFQDLPDPQEG